MKVYAALILAILLLPTAGLGQDPGNGKQLYQEYMCYSCHGYNGTSPIRPLANDVSGIMTNEALFLTYLRLRSDVNQVTATRSMPNYAESTLSDEQAKDIYAYIKTFQEDSPEVADDPLMQQILDAAKARKPADE